MKKYSKELEYLAFLEYSKKYLSSRDISDMIEYAHRCPGVDRITVMADLDRRMVRARLIALKNYRATTVRRMIIDKWRSFFPKLDSYNIQIKIERPPE